MQQNKNKGMTTQSVLNIGLASEEVEEDGNKLVGQILKWPVVLSLRAARGGSEKKKHV